MNCRIILIYAFVVSLAITSRGESFLTNIIDGFGTNAGGPYAVGLTGPFNALIITNGGGLTNSVGYVGYAKAAGNNRAHVVGSGSRWVNFGTVSVGQEGSENRLTIESGAVVSDTTGTIGVQLSAVSNVVEVTGPGSRWQNSGGPIIGNWGSGNRLAVSDGGFVRGASGFIGWNSGVSNNVASVSGAGSLWTNAGPFFVGSNGCGNQLTVSNGAVFGAGGDLTIGNNGSFNSVSVHNGAQVLSQIVTLGAACGGSNNTALVTGAGSLWTNVGMTVGRCSSRNQLTIADGGRVVSASAASSPQGGEGNSILIRDHGSQWLINGRLDIGMYGTNNQIGLLGGAQLSSGNSSLGWAPSGGNSGPHSAVIAGSGTLWSNTSLLVGGLGSGGNAVVVDQAAQIDSGEVRVGLAPTSSSNTISLSGVGTSWNIRTNLSVGVFGAGNMMSVGNGARLTTLNLYLAASVLVVPAAASPSDGNRLIVAGANSVVSASSNLLVGYQGSFNAVELHEGAVLTSVNALIGVRSGAGNYVLVTGGSAWTNAGPLIVGSNGWQSQMVISGGGVVNDSTGYIGFYGACLSCGTGCASIAGSNTVVVSDPGSRWNNTGPLYVGYASGGNSLLVSNGAVVTAASLTVGEFSAQVGPDACYPDSSELVVDGGCVLLPGGFLGGPLNVRYGKLVLRRGLVHAGRLTATNGVWSHLQLTGGTLRTRDARIQNTAPLDVGDGLHTARLHLDGGDSLIDFINVRPHSILLAHGYLGVTVVSNAGTLSPGVSGPDTLSIGNGSIVQLPGASLLFDISGANFTERDFIGLKGTLHLDGVLRVRLHSGFVPSSNHVFTVASADEITGVFANVANGGRLKTENHLGSFLVDYSTNRIHLRDYQSADLDGDGVEDAWATNYFAHTPLTLSEKLADADGDGATNYDEFRAGTDPTDLNNVLRISVRYAGGAATLAFPFVEGKAYRIWSSEDLIIWNEVILPTFAYPAAGICEWSDVKHTGQLGAASRFYRVQVE